MKRRDFMAASAAALAMPAVGRAQGARVLRFVPLSDLTSLDPVWTSAYVTRSHGYLIFDTLYGQTGTRGGFKVTPQMVAGHAIEDDGRTWKLILRDRLMFHDGQKVLARDCVASIRRWGARDPFGQSLMERVDDLSAPDDKTIVFRLRKPFPQLADALGKCASPMCPIMPERLANTDPYKQITEAMGSGPYRFKPDERLQGSRFVYERFADYVPREASEPPEATAGPKIAHFDRIEWHIIPDPATAAAALQQGQVDGWESPTSDLLPLLARDRKLKQDSVWDNGFSMTLRPNHLFPPFDKPGVRRALLDVIDQTEVVMAATGTDPDLWKVPCGFFPPASSMASDAGIDVLTGQRNYERAKHDLYAAGYNGESVTLMVAADRPAYKAASDVIADMMKRAGMNVDYQSIDWGTLTERRANRKPPAQGGWNLFCVGLAGMDLFNPASHPALRGNGLKAYYGWPTSPALEALHDAWLDAADLAEQRRLAREIQGQAFDDVPYYPLGLYYGPSVYRADWTGILRGFPIFWNLRRV